MLCLSVNGQQNNIRQKKEILQKTNVKKLQQLAEDLSANGLKNFKKTTKESC